MEHVVASDAATRAFMDLSPDAVLVIDSAGLIRDANTIFTATVGFALEDVAGQPLSVITPVHERRSTVLARLQQTHTLGTASSQRLAVLAQDNTHLDMSVTARAITVHGEPAALLVMRNVTGMQVIRDRLVRSERDLRAVIDAHPDALTMTRAVRDESGTIIDFEIVFANAAAAALRDITPAETRGMRVRSDMTEAAFAEYAELVDHGSEGEAIDSTVEWVDPDTGENKAWFSTRTAKHGNGLVSAFRDVTKTVQATGIAEAENEALSESNAELTESVAYQQRFLGTASHELRTPLAAVIGFADILMSHWDDLDDERRRSYLATIQRNAARQSLIVDNMIDASRMATGELGLQIEPMELGTAIVNAVTKSPGAEEAVALRGDISLRALADVSRVAQIIHNLLDNALKYGAAPIELTLAREGEDVVSLTVSDAGPGIDSDFLPSMFEPFTQAKPGRESPGAGLGLHLASGLAGYMSGQLTYETNEGGGASFTLQLPASG